MDMFYHHGSSMNYKAMRTIKTDKVADKQSYAVLMLSDTAANTEQSQMRINRPYHGKNNKIIS